MKKTLMLLVLLMTGPALADQTVRMSDGRVCTFRNGHFINCTHRPSSTAPTVAEQYLMQKTEDRQKLTECLRKADWPGMPGKDDCLKMYGR